MRLKTVGAGLATAGMLAGGGSAVVDANINPYVVSDSKYELSAVSVIEDAGEIKVEAHRDRPAVTLSKWNGEAAVTVSYPQVVAHGARQLFTDRVEWKSAKEEVHAYPLDPKPGMEDGGFEIEVYLEEPPASHVFEFSIEGAEEFDAAYQAPLDEEHPDARNCSATECDVDGNGEIDTWRPENVVGSYALTHRTKQDYQKGGTNFGTGKALHIYRPKAIDANGAERWCELRLSSSTLGVDCSLHAKWFEAAAYPILIDPTLGYTSVGGTQTTDSGRTIYGQVVVASGGTLVDINIYCNWNNAGSGTIASAWYSNAAGDPSSKVYTTTGQADCQSAAPAWRAGTLTGTFTSGTFWIGMHNGSGPIRYYYDATGASETDNTLSSLPSTATPTNTNTSRNYSVYVTYTAAATIVPDMTYFEIID